MVPPRGVSSTGSEEECCLLGLGECSGAREEGAAGADGCSIGEAPCVKVIGVRCGCLSHQYVIGSYQCASEFLRAGF